MGIYSDVLLTVDYDRTLTAPDSTIPERNLTAIRYFIDNIVAEIEIFGIIKC